MEYVVYKIHCNITDEDYYGSTHNFKQRIGCHLVNTEKQNAKPCCEAKKIIDRGDFAVSVMETCEQNNKTFALWRERHYMETYPCINVRIPIVSAEEKKVRVAAYMELHKEYFDQKKIEYYKSNQEALKNKSNEFYKAHCVEINTKKREAKYDCECGMKEVSKGHKARHDKTRIHQDYLLNLTLYVKPVKTYDEKRGDKYTCVCGGKYSHTHISTHSKTKRHQDFMLNQDVP